MSVSTRFRYNQEHFKAPILHRAVLFSKTKTKIYYINEFGYHTYIFCRQYPRRFRVSPQFSDSNLSNYGFAEKCYKFCNKSQEDVGSQEKIIDKHLLSEIVLPYSL